jgi:HlyD family secretion protein
MKNFIKNYWAVCIPIVVLVIALIYLLQNKSSESSSKDAVIGMVDAEFVDVSASLPGRVLELLVKEGDDVKEGQIIAQMKTSEIESIQSQVSEAVKIAQNQLDKVNRGVEPEVLKSAENLQQIANSRWI